MSRVLQRILQRPVLHIEYFQGCRLCFLSMAEVPAILSAQSLAGLFKIVNLSNLFHKTPGKVTKEIRGLADAMPTDQIKWPPNKGH